MTFAKAKLFHVDYVLLSIESFFKAFSIHCKVKQTENKNLTAFKEITLTEKNIF